MQGGLGSLPPTKRFGTDLLGLVILEIPQYRGNVLSLQSRYWYAKNTVEDRSTAFRSTLLLKSKP